MKKLLCLQNISFSTTEGNFKIFASPKIILKDISMEIFDGNFIALSGKSGSGKSTLAKIIAGIINPTQGKIEYDNIEQNEIQILFQNNLELINPNRVVKDIIDEALNLSRQNDNDFSREEIFNVLEIPSSILDKRGFQLSGGQRQKVGMARVLFQKPKLLIMDEPFAAQDFEAVDKITQLLRTLNSNYKMTIICISHITKFFNGFNGKHIVIDEGKIISESIL